MDEATKTKMKGELIGIQSMIFGVSGQITAAGAANVPVVTPTGPVPILAFNPIISALKGQQDVTEKLFKFVEKLFDELS